MNSTAAPRPEKLKARARLALAEIESPSGNAAALAHLAARLRDAKAKKTCRVSPRATGLKKSAGSGRPLPKSWPPLSRAVRDMVGRLIADVYGRKIHPRVAAGLAPLLNLQLRD
jgi:hypothetical protein